MFCFKDLKRMKQIHLSQPVFTYSLDMIYGDFKDLAKSTASDKNID